MTIREGLIRYLLNNGFKTYGNAQGDALFERTRRGHSSVFLKGKIIEHTHVESGGIKEGWERNRFKYTKKDVKKLKEKLTWEE